MARRAQQRPGADASPPSVALALQGGGAHGALTWGVLDRLLEEVERGALRIAAISGASAGAINAALTAAGLAAGGAGEARGRLRRFWESFARRGTEAGNALFGFAEPGAFGWNIDWSPMAIMLEAMGLVVSPYNNPFYADALKPLLDAALSPDDVARLNGASAPPLFISATDICDNARIIFTQPEISIDTLRASACLPEEFRTVTVGGIPFWDGGYLGNPPLRPLIDICQDLLLIMINPLHRDGMPPTNARAILDRLNEIAFNASVVLEINAIEAVNKLLAELRQVDPQHESQYKLVRFHLIRDDRFAAQLGFVSKSSTSWPFVSRLFAAGREAADRWLGVHRASLGVRSSCDVKTELTNPVLKPGRVTPSS